MGFSTEKSARRTAVTVFLAGATLVASAAPALAGTPVVAHRTFGPDRYTTATIMENYQSRDTAYIVTGTRFADGVTAGAVAGREGSNLFLSPQGELPESVRKVIGYYRNVVVVGDENSIASSVTSWLQQNTRAHLTRVGGVDRYDTAAKLSAAEFSPGVSTVFITTGLQYADALAAAPAAVQQGAPVLTVPGTSIPDPTEAELRRLAPKSIVVLGDAKAVSDGVLAQLQAYTPGKVTRIGGADRYETAVQISQRYFSGPVGFVQLASGTSWPDAIVAGANAARSDSPLLLTGQYCIPQSVNLEIERLHSADLQAVGGEGSYSAAAAKRTSCEAPSQTYLDDLTAPTGNAKFIGANVTLNGVFYPRTVAYSTYAPVNPSAQLPNGEYRTWSLGSGYSHFTTVAGVADGTTSGLSSVVQVYGDERLLGSYQVSVGKPAFVDLDVRGVDKLKVVTTSSVRTVAGESDPVVYLGDAAVL